MGRQIIGTPSHTLNNEYSLFSIEKKLKESFI
jgi:hypothetical protein